ncbi:protein FAR1-RELATED SEQUENCE 5-like [Vigna unguiculata]|uniref:protein FAR1-RELATED SEQUENCE 5-like n=1 Tax=Vigna unguiculata TaxID=3917 RepID=UPI001016BDD3|nr:protein FAR1-RELATED SEQUENCE 5-like [Vigna unguiculata]
MHVRQTVDINDEAGVRINKSFRSLVCEAGRYDNITFIERDVRNYIGKQRRSLCKDGDGQALLRHFSQMRELNNDFFFDIDMDENNRICNVFWANAKSRATCQDFGDVVSFDTTYLTNKYNMSFAPFVGVNHHGQSILLGCGLVSCEDTSTFVWLFECWRQCMFNVEPDGIVTDQCKAMMNAIKVVFSNTKHRWCLWHIMKKVLEKLQGYTNYKPIKTELKKLVYDSICVNDLNANEWLSTLYDERHRWYDNALRQKAEKEFEADFTSANTTVACGSQSPIERQFQLEYTHAKFSEIQNEFRGKMNCFMKSVSKDETAWKYMANEEWMWNG